MLNEAQNRLLMEVGPGTPMGALLRRYWHPIAAVAEFDARATKPVRLMGEDLVLYRDLGGTYGLLERHCAHRRADLAHGFVEDCGLRCHYHGWLYDETGACLAQPYEDVVNPSKNLRGKVRLKAYLVAERAGLLWAYLGPEPAPLVPNWEPFGYANCFRQIVFSEVPCNWFQCQENSIDPVHLEWLHANWGVRLGEKEGGYAPAHLKVGFKEFDWGFTYHRIREDTDETHSLWTVGRTCLWPNCFFTGSHFEWRVPVDDENTLSVAWFFNRVPHEREPFVQDRIPSWVAPVADGKTGRFVTSHVMNQDFVGWIGQGRQADRTKERLGASDKGVVMVRRRFLADLKRIEKGEDPKAVVRDAAVNACIELPMTGKRAKRDGFSIGELDKLDSRERVVQRDFVHLAGQPDEIRRAYEEAMGFATADRA